jgi:hypothetical protein
MVNRNNKYEIDWAMIIIALVALAIGIVVYIYDRPASHIYFVPELLSHYQQGTRLFGFVGYHIPEFVHVFAFSLLTAAIFGRHKKDAMFICLFWLFIDALFEIAQYQKIANSVVPYIPDWFNEIPLLENTKNYFLYGRFDVLDLIAIATGAAIAYFMILFMYTRHNSRSYSCSQN